MTTGADIAKDALTYQGAAYTYGGRADHPGDWDCSSFVSYVLGHDLGLVLPGGGRYGDGAYPPHAHGPVVSAYAGWPGATLLPPGQPPAAGDLCIWNGAGPLGHIGIATDAAHMISALNHASGTVHTPIAGYGPRGAALTFHRVNKAGQVPGASGDGSGAAVIAAALAGLGIGAAVPLLILAAAGVAGIVGAFALVTVIAAARGG